MSKLSVIIPSRNEMFLKKTVEDLLNKARGDIEIIITLDGILPQEWPVNDDRIIYIYHGISKGMRRSINDSSAVATGEFLMKCDAHCMFCEGFDEILKADCDKDWIVIPRRKRLDAENWCPQPGKENIDYEFLSYPWWKPEEPGLHGTQWNDRTRQRTDPRYDIDDNMGFQGSCWFTHREYFHHFGGMSEIGYGTFIGEPQELGNKAWLSGGAVKVNKKAWYAHLHKGSRYGRGYSMGSYELRKGNLYSVNFWYNNCWDRRTRDIEWLVDHFWPVPSWPGRERDSWKPLTLSQNGTILI